MPELSPEWKSFLDQQMAQPYMQELKKKLDDARSKVNIHPRPELTFNAFVQCPYWDMKVIIVGQDPYCTPGAAHGLAFSSLDNKTPQALKNIFDEIYDDIYSRADHGFSLFQHNNLTQWSRQGVLLLNAILTVEEGKPQSHKGWGWETFMAEAIKYINQHQHRLVFMFWGNAAKAYKKLIDETKHLVLESEHPAAAIHNQNAWFGNKHFSKANAFIKKHYFNIKVPVNWSVLMRPAPTFEELRNSK